MHSSLVNAGQHNPLRNVANTKLALHQASWEAYSRCAQIGTLTSIQIGHAIAQIIKNLRREVGLAGVRLTAGGSSGTFRPASRREPGSHQPALARRGGSLYRGCGRGNGKPADCRSLLDARWRATWRSEVNPNRESVLAGESCWHRQRSSQPLELRLPLTPPDLLLRSKQPIWRKSRQATFRH